MPVFNKSIISGLSKKIKSVTRFTVIGNLNFSSAYSKSDFLRSDLPDIDIPKIPVNEFVFRKIDKWENRIAVKCAITGRNYTYKQLKTKSQNLGAALRKKLKLNKGDVVCVLLPNVPEFPIAAIGIPTGGLVCTMVNPSYTPGELSRQLLDSSAKAIITLTDFFPLSEAAKAVIKKNIPIITINMSQHQSTPRGAISFNELTDNPCEFNVSISQDDIAYLPYSSGTTGAPKGVQLSHSNLIANLSQILHSEVVLSAETTNDHQDNTPAIIPFFHIYGLSSLCLCQLTFGCQTVTIPKFTPEVFINVLKTNKPDILFLAPPLVNFLAQHPHVMPEYLDRTRGIITGAAPLVSSDVSKLLTKLNRNIPVLPGYGLTETSPTVLVRRLSHIIHNEGEGSLGKPVANTEVKIVAVDDNKGINLGPNEQGELLVRGPQVMKGYLNNNEENSFLEGWFKTGDIMYYDEKGFFFITDRLKELIKVKGFQVAPSELEEIIRTFPNVSEVAVIGVPHESRGEVPRAFIVPHHGKKLDCNVLIEYVKQNVAPYKQLAGGVSIVESLPKNPSGKIMKNELKMIHEMRMKKK